MKCPKCGYQSFNFLSTCKKCGRDLTEVQERFRLGDPIFPQSSQPAPTVSDPPPADDPSEPALSEEESGDFAFIEPDDAEESLSEPFDDTGTAEEALPEGKPDNQENAAWTEPADEKELTMDFPDDVELQEDPFTEDWTEQGTSDEEAFAPLGENLSPAEAVEPFLESGGDETPQPTSETNGDQEATFAQDMPGEGGPEEDLLDEESELDAWLVDGEEPSWRHKEPQAEETGELSGDEMPDDAADWLPDEHDQAEQVANGTPKPSPVARLLGNLLDLALLLGSFALFVLAGEYLLGGGRLAWPPSAQLADHAGPYFLVFFGLAFGYFTLFHYLTGQTPGKMAAKLVVTDQKGQPLQLSQAFLRSVGGLMCLLPVGLGFCSVLLNPEGRGWNDRLAGTRLAAAGKAASPDEAGA